MEKICVTVSMEEERLKALEFVLKKKNSSVQRRMDDALRLLYEKEVPGLAVWKSGHIGVYIGDDQVIEAMGTKYGVVKTQLQGRGWTHWLEIPYINYD